MGSAIAIDKTEHAINNFDAALHTLERLPPEHQQLKYWNKWADVQFASQPWYPHLQQCMTIAYARMASRNGSLSNNPRSYHNELHINDILLRIIYCADNSGKELTPDRLALLCYFAVCHDLRQAEPRIPDEEALVGANEIASFHEAKRLIESNGGSELWDAHHLLLLKTMIDGSTFGSGGKRSKNFFQGNLAKYLLDQLQFTDSKDEQLVLLACDLDTANVSLPISQFATSAVRIYDELVSHHDDTLSAHQFFSSQQRTYFFDQQVFHANITQTLFEPHKRHNSKKLMQLANHIEQLPVDTPPELIKTAFKVKAKQLES